MVEELEVVREVCGVDVVWQLVEPVVGTEVVVANKVELVSSSGQ